MSLGEEKAVSDERLVEGDEGLAAQLGRDEASVYEKTSLQNEAIEEEVSSKNFLIFVVLL